MIDDLKTASTNLQVALEQYLHVCNGLFTTPQGRALSPPSKEDVQQVDTELVSILSHEESIRGARLNISRARNRLFSFSPVNALPPEVLAYIFEVVVDSQPCILEAVYDEVSINREHAYPDLLVQVCSRWRHIAESHPSLWAHIDFVPNHGHAKLMSRATKYAKGAQLTPLEVHIIDTEHAQYNYWDLVKFLESLAGQMKALELCSINKDIGKFCSLVLEKLLPKSNPSIFTRFSFEYRRDHMNVFIVPSGCTLSGAPPEHSCLPVNISQDVLERIFVPFKALDLCSTFPVWSSKAYHGLVELRLTSSRDHLYSQIPEQDLIAILKASPKLRILHFAIDIIYQHLGSNLDGSVTLNDLEELEVIVSIDFQDEPMLEVGSLLRFLTPGKKPLRLMLRTLEYWSSAPWERIKGFLTRANVAKFHAKTGAPLIDEILRLMPHLTELTFSCTPGLGRAAGITVDALKQAIRDAATAKYRLTSLVMHDCPIYLEQLRLVAELCPTKSLVLHDVVFWENEEAMKPMSDAQVSQLSNLIPAMKIIQKEKWPSPNIDLEPATAFDPFSDSDSDLSE